MYESRFPRCSLTSVRTSVGLSSVICDWLRTIKPTTNKLQAESNKGFIYVNWDCESWEHPCEQD